MTGQTLDVDGGWAIRSGVQPRPDSEPVPDDDGMVLTTDATEAERFEA